MQKVLHETCQKYVTRRLSEGWSIVWQRGVHLILSSPDGNILRPVDLRNDVETLRPNAAGDEENIDEDVGNGAGEHHTLVDEAEADEYDTYVMTDSVSYQRDLYNTEDHSVGSGSINHITVYARAISSDNSNQVSLKIAIKSGTGSGAPDTPSESVGKQTNGTWTNYSNQWSVNPATSSAWTWDEIDKLQIGISLRNYHTDGGGFKRTRCTQVYVEVDYVGITPKTSSDTGSGADAHKALSPISGGDSGSGVDAKKTGEPKAAYARSETGGGVDGHKAVAPQSAGETGSGVDALTALLGILARSETGLGTDAKLSLLAALVKADAGSGVEHILDRALVLISESGSGLDVSHLVKTLMLTDGGTAAENSYLHILEGVRDSSDSGTGVEASSLTTLLQRDETGEGVESVAARALFSREPQMGAIDLARVITAAITGAETGTGAEASLMAYYQKKADSGEGVDSSELEALFTGEDSGAGAEAFTLLAAMVAHDTGVSVESVLSFFKKAIDSGHGEENLLLVGFVGRAMKLITYLQNYSDLVVYTKPYSDLRVYNAEVKQV